MASEDLGPTDPITADRGDEADPDPENDDPEASSNPRPGLRFDSDVFEILSWRTRTGEECGSVGPGNWLGDRENPED